MKERKHPPTFIDGKADRKKRYRKTKRAKSRRSVEKRSVLSKLKDVTRNELASDEAHADINPEDTRL